MPEASGSQAAGRVRAVGLWLGPLLALACYAALGASSLDEPARRLAAVVVLMATWWITEAVPLAATALLPLALFQPLDIAPMRQAASAYSEPVIFLFLGGFMLGKALERWGAHRRLALHVILRVGARPKQIVAGVMIATVLLGCFVSNTATAVMMLPIVSSIAALAGGDDPDAPEARRYAACLLLGMAWSASIGGMATLTGTPPNGIFAGFMADQYDVHISWGRWLPIGAPVTLILLPLAWAILVYIAQPVRIGAIPGGRAHIRAMLEGMGRPARGEKLTGLVFASVAGAWVLHAPLTALLNRGRVGADRFIGWHDAAIAMLGAVALFVLPAGRGERVLDWKSAEKIPWGVLILFGGGLAVSSAFSTTGLDAWLGGHIAGLGTPPLLLALVCIVLLIQGVGELTSNTATVSTMLPVVASIAVGMGFEPGPLLLAVALTASCGFMLPVATPPNAIIFSTGKLTIMDMVKAGLWMNLASTIVIVLYVWLLGARLMPSM